MNGLPLETQGQLAAAVALLSLVFGAASWELSVGAVRWIGRATIAAGVLQLMAFSQYAVRQYHVLVVRTNIPLVEVANADSGRERTIERIECPEGTIVEREHIAGWRFVSADGPGHATGRKMFQRTQSSPGVDTAGASNRRTIEDCAHCILGVPGCCGCGGACCTSGANYNAAGISTSGVAGVSF